MKAVQAVYSGPRTMPELDVPRLLAVAHAELEAWTVPDLRAPYWRWYWHDADGTRLVGAEQVWLPTGDEIVLLPPETACRGELHRPVSQVYFHFTLARPVQGPPAPVLVSVGAGERNELRQLGREIRDSALAGSPHRARWLAQAWVLRALARLPERAWAPTTPVDAAVERARHLIDARYPAAPSLQTLSRAAGLSPNALLRRFRATTGLSPRQYLHHRRLADACARLHHSRETIEEIAAATGFYDRYHFTRVFTRARGLGPAAFRRLGGTGTNKPT